MSEWVSAPCCGGPTLTQDRAQSPPQSRRCRAHWAREARPHGRVPKPGNEGGACTLPKPLRLQPRDKELAQRWGKGERGREGRGGEREREMGERERGKETGERDGRERERWERETGERERERERRGERETVG